MTALSVNLNKIALIRNSRPLGIPRVETFARRALEHGAMGVTLHPRPDQRHATYQDVRTLRALVSEFPGRELNIEGNPDAAWMDIVLECVPHQATLVPDSPEQLTSDHGWDVISHVERLTDLVTALHEKGIRVSLFLDPDERQLDAVIATGADRIELYTEPYARAFAAGQYETLLKQYADVAGRARALGLGVNAGHDLDLHNTAPFCTATEVDEVSIGHALTCEALDYGFDETVRRYVNQLQALKPQG